MHVKTNDMKYTSQAKQLTIDDFKSSLEGLSKSNRWVQLGDSLPWAKNEIEATFGTGKRVYRADNIRAKMPDTAASWIGSCYFVKNVMKFFRELCLVLSEIWLFIEYLLSKGALVCEPLVMVKY